MKFLLWLPLLCIVSLERGDSHERDPKRSAAESTRGSDQHQDHDKKFHYLHEKTTAPFRKFQKPAKKASRPLWLRNLRTHEISLMDPLLAKAALRSQFFRCWFSEEDTIIPEEILKTIAEAAEHFSAREIQIISAYRHPKFNLWLRKKGREVARKSQHTQGVAIDFFLPEVDTKELYDWLHATHTGGLGYYPESQFVHVDLGRNRRWRGH